MRKMLKKHIFVPEAFVTDKLQSYGAALGNPGLPKRQNYATPSNPQHTPTFPRQGDGEIAGCDSCRINHDIRRLKARLVAVNLTTPFLTLSSWKNRFGNLDEIPQDLGAARRPPYEYQLNHKVGVFDRPHLDARAKNIGKTFGIYGYTQSGCQ